MATAAKTSKKVDNRGVKFEIARIANDQYHVRLYRLGRKIVTSEAGGYKRRAAADAAIEFVANGKIREVKNAKTKAVVERNIRYRGSLVPVVEVDERPGK